MSLTDFLNGAPKFITSRFNSVNRYVWQNLFPEEVIKELIKRQRTKEEKRLEYARFKEISDEASTLVFLFLLNKFFLEGANAAKQAVDTFKELDVNGFYIGGSYFSERNDKVIQGDIISEQLLNTIKDVKAKELVSNSKYVSQIIDTYRKLI